MGDQNWKGRHTCDQDGPRGPRVYQGWGRRLPLVRPPLAFPLTPMRLAYTGTNDFGGGPQERIPPRHPLQLRRPNVSPHLFPNAPRTRYPIRYERPGALLPHFPPSTAPYYLR